MVTARYPIPSNDGRTINTTITDRASVIGQWLSSINSISGFTSQSQEQYAPPWEEVEQEVDYYPCYESWDEEDYTEYGPWDEEEEYYPANELWEEEDDDEEEEYPEDDESSPQEVVVVGLDIEWKPNRRRTENNPAATLQLCVYESCLIIQLCYLDHFPRSLRTFLTNPNYLFVGVGVHDDATKLWRDYGLECACTCDVRDVAVKEYPEMFSNKPGLQEVYQELTGFWLEKPRYVTRSNWENEVLTYQQVEYGCLDAYASCRIGEVLQVLGVL